MKKFSVILSSLAIAAIAFVGCQQVEENAPASKKITLNFAAETVDPAASKATLTPNEGETAFAAAWDNGDELGIFGKMEGTVMDDNVKGIWNGSNFTTEFDGYEGLECSFIGVYPYNSESEIDFGSSRIQNGNIYNSKYDVMLSDEIAATLSDDATIVLPMHRQTAIAYFHLTGTPAEGETIQSATLTIDAEEETPAEIAGGFLYDASGIVPVEDSNSITITFAEGTNPSADDFTLWFNVLPVSYKTLKLEVTTENYTLTINNSNAGSYVAGKLYKVSAEIPSNMWVANTKYIASFSINGVVDAANNQELAAGAVVPFPEVVAPAGKVFVGWAKNAIDGTQDTAPEMVTVGEEVMGTENTTYHAVFATQSGSGTSSLTKMVKGDVLHDGDKIVIVAPDANVALYRETVSTSYVNKYTFDNNIATVIADDKNWIPINAVEGGFSLGDATNGYIYSSSNNLYCGETQQAWTLMDLNDGTFKLQRDGRNLSYRSDLSSNNYWRMGGASYGTSGETTLNLYKLDNEPISFSEYCTIVATLTSVTISGTPQKTSYFENERFDVTGLVVTANYSDGSNQDVTADAQWTITPSLLTTGTTSVSVVAQYESVLSEAQNYNVTVSALTLESISIETAPTKVTYEEGEFFSPAGLVITRSYNNNTSDNYQYAGHESEFSFVPALTAPLTPTNNKVAITYGGKSVEQTITVNAALGTMDEIFAAATAARSNPVSKTIKFNNWIVTGVKGSNAYLTDGTNGCIIYTSGHGFEAGDVLSGTVNNLDVLLYNGASEIKGLKSTSTGLTVTKGGTVTVNQVGIADLSGINTGSVIFLSAVRYDGSNFSDGTNTIKPYASIMTNLPSLTTGQKYNVTGVYVQFGDTKEIAPRSTADVEVYVAPSYTITIDNNIPHGQISANATEAQEGVEITLSATPDKNYRLAGWDVKDADNTAVTVTNNKFTMPAKAVTVSATFEEIPTHTVTLATCTNGSVSASINGSPLTSGAAVQEGTVIDIIATPASDSFIFSSWDIKGATVASASASTTITVGTDNIEIGASFSAYEPSTTKTEILTNSEITTNFTNTTMAYNNPKTYVDGDITWEVSGYADAANRPWMQLKKDEGVYVKITAPSNISEVRLTITSTENSKGGVTDISKHTAFSGTARLKSADATGNTTTSDICTSNEVSNNTMVLSIPNSTYKVVYVKVATGARIWGIEVDY